MFLVFLRHGSVAALLAGVGVVGLAFLSGWIEPRLALILLGALLFYGSEYGMHRFAFHAPPLSWPLARKLQHRLHYDHHVEPSRLDLLFLPIWFGAQSRCRCRAGRAGVRRGRLSVRAVRHDAGDPAL